ncbi:MAG TPA: glycosyltransferase [Vicinamibacteria bacterium]|nr:glycosyltransferase [Vicinamibacteria bacterium]
MARAGFATSDVCGYKALAAALREAGSPVWLVRAGAWSLASPFEPPPPSATSRPLLALGAVLGDSEAAASWRDVGDLERGPLPVALSVWLEAPLARALADLVEDGLRPGLLGLREAWRPRVVRASALDVEDDEHLRVAQIVTSLQQGGAERVALDLSVALPAQGLSTLLAVVSEPSREAFATPRGVALLEWDRAAERARRAEPLGRALVASGIDVAHAHLLDREDVRLLGRAGVPMALTLHNARPGWPAGTESLEAGEASLLVACSRAVERDVLASGLEGPCRTVWNGIDFGSFASTPSGSGGEWRARLGFEPDDFVMLAVANPRPQKRLERLPEILRDLRGALRERGVARQARLVVAGSPSAGSADSVLAAADLERAVERSGVADHVRLLGAVKDVGPLLRAADVLISTSAHEGLSLAQLEALASDLPVVTTAVGGAPEVAEKASGVSLVSADAPSNEFVPPLLALACAGERPSLAPAASAHFALRRMAADYARLLRSVAAAAAPARREGLLLVANNFSTGGAQSSARRLLLELRRRGVRVRAAVIQEQPAHPTPGRRALEAAGVPVLAVPPPEDLEPAAAIARILEWIETDRPQAVVFWNVIVQHKLLLADTLFDVPVFDVSPGEMFFASLERYFANPRPGLPYATPGEYGARLAGVVVKYGAEAACARSLLGAPVHVIPNGLEAREARLPPPANGRITIGTLARLDPRKRVDRLLRALRLAAPRLPPYLLRIGGGPEPGFPGHGEELRRMAEGLHVEFVGDVDADEFLPGLDVFALVAEPAGCPNASLEAMAYGLPVVATDAGGMREQIVDRVSGRLVPREDEPALATALVELCADGEVRRRLGTGGRERVRTRFSIRTMADAYQDLLRQAT